MMTRFRRVPPVLALVCFACFACFACLAYFAGPVRATILPVHMGLGPVTGALPDPGRWELMAMTRPFYTKGWMSTEIKDLSKWNGLKVEIRLADNLPAAAHLHVVLMPLTHATLKGMVGIPGDPLGTWPQELPSTDAGADQQALVRQSLVADFWMGDLPKALYVYADGVKVIGNPFQDKMAPGQGAEPGADSGYPFPDATNFYDDYLRLLYVHGGGPGDPHLKNHLGVQEPHGPAIKGKEFRPGGTVRIDLSSYVAGWDGVRVAVACYHQDPESGAESIFQMYPTDHADTEEALVSADEVEYRNDPFLLWLPWHRVMSEPSIVPAWVGLDAYFRRPVLRPSMWQIFGKVPDTIPNFAKGFEIHVAFVSSTPPVFLDWPRVIGDETSKWLMSFSQSYLDLAHWGTYQYHMTDVTTTYDANAMPIDTKREFPEHVNVGQAMLAQWYHLAYSLLFQHLPYYEGAAASFPSTWMWPMSFGGDGFRWPGGLEEGQRTEIPTPGWYEGRFATWSMPSNYHGIQWGIGNQGSPAEGNPAGVLPLWAPSLPLAFGQTRVLKSFELWNLVFEAHANVMNANYQATKVDLILNMIWDLMTANGWRNDLGEWMEWVNAIPQFRSSDSQQWAGAPEDRWDPASSKYRLDQLFQFYFGYDWATSALRNPLDWLAFYFSGTTYGMDGLVQPKYYLSTANYPVGSFRVWVKTK